jgi:hypothetical protein
MCGSSPPKAPPAPPPLPTQAPLPPPAVLSTADEMSTTEKSMKQQRGRQALRIDKTQVATGSTGSGLNIPT